MPLGLHSWFILKCLFIDWKVDWYHRSTLGCLGFISSNSCTTNEFALLLTALDSDCSAYVYNAKISIINFPIYIKFYLLGLDSCFKINSKSLIFCILKYIIKVIKSKIIIWLYSSLFWTIFTVRNQLS